HNDLMNVYNRKMSLTGAGSQFKMKDNGITPLQQMMSSCTGAVATSIIVTPLDVVKIRIQAQQKEFLRNKCFLYCNGLMEHICYCNGNGNGKGQPTDSIYVRKWFRRPTHFRGTIDGIYKIAKYEGITSLWSGLPPTLVMAVPATVVYFTIYDQLRVKLRKFMHLNYQPVWLPMVAGASARVFAATLISPLEMIRTKMQSTKLSYLEVGAAVKAMVNVEGKLALWKGLGPTLLRDVPFSAIYWVGYESFKQQFNEQEPSFRFSFIAGAISGTIAAIITLPFDVVKTHRQIELGENMFRDSNKSTRTTALIKTIYAQRGISGLFAGLSPRIVKVAPACAIMISTYEFGKKFFRRMNESRKQQ
ncbi:solute carrier family 25 member 40-like protein, partial [Leptotrombidium deliense]